MVDRYIRRETDRNMSTTDRPTVRHTHIYRQADRHRETKSHMQTQTQ